MLPPQCSEGDEDYGSLLTSHRFCGSTSFTTSVLPPNLRLRSSVTLHEWLLFVHLFLCHFLTDTFDL